MSSPSTDPVRRAVILAAGSGRRLREVHDGPKCLLPLAGRSLLAWQLDALAEHGIDEVVLVVGFQAEVVTAEAQALCGPRGMSLSTVLNPDFDSTNTLFSLSLAADAFHAPAVCLNGDVLFDSQALERLLAVGHDVAVAVEPKPCGDEEVKVHCDPDGRILAISKSVPLDTTRGEAVGINAFRGEGGRAFADHLRTRAADPSHRRSFFEVALEALCQQVPVHAVDLAGAPVIEIDSPADVGSALENVLPRLRRSSRDDTGVVPQAQPIA